MKVPNADRAQVDLRKLVDYALNTEHPEGRHKARVFASVLGLTSDDAELLREALLKAVQSQDAIIGEQDEFGQRYTVDFVMTGNNIQTATVRSAWIVKSNEDIPRLATVYVSGQE